MIILLPILVYMATYYVNKMIKKSPDHCHRISCDVTTLLLFFSVSLSIKGIWSIDVGAYIIAFALIVAMIITFIEWRIRKEIEIKLLLRTIWRIYFLLLSMSYFAIWIVGMIYSIWLLFQ